MSGAMARENDGGDDVDRTRTTVSVDRDVWRQLRSDAVAEGKNVSEKLEEVLADYYGVALRERDDESESTDDDTE
jgi:hypothetical protein